uniref:MIF4G domain-containing protein n=1 Tax=viral metagenome TaxID=1070528 RepID=A0A6C0EU55_9ZZZZ
MYYTLEEINLLINDKNYYLNKEVITVLDLLKTDVAVYATINEEIPNKKYEKNADQKNRYKKMHNNHVDGDLENKWDKQKIFKGIKKEEKIGIDKYIDEIRILLNKISDKNYEVNKDSIIQKIKDCLEDNEESNDDMKRVVTVLFDIAKSNKFYSQIYAKLYKELIDNFPFFNDTVVPFVNQFMDSLNNLVYVESSVDYDGFCNYNKTNENRRASMAFIVNLMKNEVELPIHILDIVLHFQNLAIKFIDEENRVNEVDEITELLNIVILMINDTYKVDDKWMNEILPKIKMFSSFKIKEKVSLSSRSIFKYKDIVDKLK